VLTIEEKPDRPVCSIHGPLRWGWFTDTRQGARWVSWTHETVPGFGAVLVPHVCDDPRQPAVRWTPDPLVAERAHRGNALVREALAAAKAQERTEKENPTNG